MTAEPALTATILPCSETVATFSSLEVKVTGSVHSAGLRVKVMLKKRPGVLERHGRGRERQAGAGGAFGLLGRFFGLDGLLSSSLR